MLSNCRKEKQRSQVFLPAPISFLVFCLIFYQHQYLSLVLFFVSAFPPTVGRHVARSLPPCASILFLQGRSVCGPVQIDIARAQLTHFSLISLISRPQRRPLAVRGGRVLCPRVPLDRLTNLAASAQLSLSLTHFFTFLDRPFLYFVWRVFFLPISFQLLSTRRRQTGPRTHPLLPRAALFSPHRLKNVFKWRNKMFICITHDLARNCECVGST